MEGEDGTLPLLPLPDCRNPAVARVPPRAEAVAPASHGLRRLVSMPSIVEGCRPARQAYLWTAAAAALPAATVDVAAAPAARPARPVRPCRVAALCSLSAVL